MQLIPLKKKFMLEELRVHPWSDFKAGLRYSRKSPVWNAMLQLTISVFAC